MSTIEIDIIIPVHNAGSTLRATLDSALSQRYPMDCYIHPPEIIYVCCYDDASTDDSLAILQEYQAKYEERQKQADQFGYGVFDEYDDSIETHFLLATSPDGVSRGAGFARNRAVDLRKKTKAKLCFLCMLDSDDEMSVIRVHDQVFHMTVMVGEEECHRALVGTQFTRDPPDASWHYAAWANALTDERLYLERFREVTLIQPTWMMSRRRFEELGGYIEAPHPQSSEPLPSASATNGPFRLIHPTADNHMTLRLAEDLRFFHAHLQAHGTLHLVRNRPLVSYKQVTATSQSSQTSRKLLLQLRTYAFEQCILRKSAEWQLHDKRFVVWGAGRDGKDFVKMLSPDIRLRVYCFVDVDDKKIEQGYYMNRDIGVKIPIVHFSLLIKDSSTKERIQKLWLEENPADDPGFGKIDKSKPGVDNGGQDSLSVVPPKKKQRTRSLHAIGDGELDLAMLQELPVVVCVALYRTNGALERNVATIGRVEGKDLWHMI